LALKNGSSTGVDCVDVKYVLSAFEAINRCVLRVVMGIQGTEAKPVLYLVAEAHPIESATAEPAVWASQKLVVGSTGVRTVEAAMLQALYDLDAQLAAGDFARDDNK